MPVLFFGFPRHDTAGRRGEADTVMMYIQPTTPSVEDLMNEKSAELGSWDSKATSSLRAQGWGVREGKKLVVANITIIAQIFPT